MQISILANHPDKVGECPVWDAALHALWWIDIEKRRIYCWQAATKVCEHWVLSQRVGCIALTVQPRQLLAALEDCIVLLSLDAETAGQTLPLPTPLASIQHPAPNMRFNDGRCDAQGRLWVTTMVMDTAQATPDGGLYCLDARSGRPVLSGPHVRGLYTGNGTGFSLEGTTLYLADSNPRVQTVWAFDFDAQVGAVSNRRTFIERLPAPGRPDGAAVDAQGNYWICATDAGAVHAYSPAGELLHSIVLPLPKPTMCAFGGAGLDELFVASITPSKAFAGYTPDHSGALLRITGLGKLGVKGREEPRFVNLRA